MSILGKVLIVVSIICSIGCAVLGYMIQTDKKQYMEQLANTEAALKKSPQPIQYTSDYLTTTTEPAATINRLNEEFSKTQTDLSTTKNDLEKTTTDLNTEKAAKQQLSIELSTVKSELETTKTALTAEKAKLEPVQQELTALKGSLKGERAEDLFAKIDRFEADIKDLTQQKNILEEKTATLTAEVTELRKLKEVIETGKPPPTLSGKVVAINKPWSFVVLDVGKDNLLAEGIELTVYRGDSFVGKIRTVAVDAKTAVADILPEWTQSDIQVGDQVFF